MCCEAAAGLHAPLFSPQPRPRAPPPARTAALLLRSTLQPHLTEEVLDLLHDSLEPGPDQTAEDLAARIKATNKHFITLVHHRRGHGCSQHFLKADNTYVQRGLDAGLGCAWHVVVGTDFSLAVESEQVRVV